MGAALLLAEQPTDAAMHPKFDQPYGYDTLERENPTPKAIFFGKTGRRPLKLPLIRTGFLEGTPPLDT